MGTLIYGGGSSYPIDDRALAHLKVAAGSKLRRQESFYLSWNVSPENGSGRVTLWLSPSIPLEFVFAGSRTPALNRQWIEAMLATSTGDRGMLVLPEEDAAEVLAAAAAHGAPIA